MMRQINTADVLHALRSYRAALKAMDAEMPEGEIKRLEDFEIFVAMTKGWPMDDGTISANETPNPSAPDPPTPQDG
jgi:hypothetical protein